MLLCWFSFIWTLQSHCSPCPNCPKDQNPCMQAKCFAVLLPLCIDQKFLRPPLQRRLYFICHGPANCTKAKTDTTVPCSLLADVEGSPLTTLVSGSNFTATWHLAYAHRVSIEFLPTLEIYVGVRKRPTWCVNIDSKVWQEKQVSVLPLWKSQIVLFDCHILDTLHGHLMAQTSSLGHHV